MFRIKINRGGMKLEEGNMTCKYKLQDVRLEKIKSPIVLNLDGVEMEYKNGRVLANAVFGERYFIESITAENNKIILEAVENNKYGKVYWTDKKVSMFDGTEE